MLIHIILLLFSTIIWGFGFIAARWSFAVVDPFWSTALRFCSASLVSLPYLVIKGSFYNNIKTIKRAAVSAILLYFTLLFQTIGLLYTTVAKSGFITTLYALFIPIMMMLITHKRYKKSFWFLVLIAMIGMAFLCNLELKELNKGDFFTLICSLFASGHIIYIGYVSSKVKSSIEFNFLQIFFITLYSIAIAFFMKGKISLRPFFENNFLALYGILFLGIVSSVGAFTIQVVAQKKIPPHIAGLIFLMESPFAAVFGYFIFLEKLTSLNLFGCFLVMLSVILVPLFGREIEKMEKVTAK